MKLLLNKPFTMRTVDRKELSLSEDTDNEESDTKLIEDDDSSYKEISNEPLYYTNENRCLILSSEIDANVAASLIDSLLGLSLLDEKAPIYIDINSPGGGLTDGLAIYDAIREIPNPVIATVRGQCASAGLLVLLACDYRVASESSSFMYHEPILGLTISQMSELDNGAELYRWSKNKTEAIVKKETTVPPRVWKKRYKSTTGYYFFTEEALKYGFINAIIDSRKPESANVTLPYKIRTQ